MKNQYLYIYIFMFIFIYVLYYTYLYFIYIYIHTLILHVFNLKSKSLLVHTDPSDEFKEKQLRGIGITRNSVRDTGSVGLSSHSLHVLGNLRSFAFKRHPVLRSLTTPQLRASGSPKLVTLLEECFFFIGATHWPLLKIDVSPLIQNVTQKSSKTMATGNA